MIVDCRRANRRFNEPPNMVLASPGSLSTLDVSESDTLYTSTVDVRDSFYRIRIPEKCSEYFALLQLTRQISTVASTVLKGASFHALRHFPWVSHDTCG